MADVLAQELLLKTGRGLYALKLGDKPRQESDALVLPIVLEHKEGLERLGFVCRLLGAWAAVREGDELSEVLARIGEHVSRDFERLREAALKSWRAEKKLYELTMPAKSA